MLILKMTRDVENCLMAEKVERLTVEVTCCHLEPLYLIHDRGKLTGNLF